MYNILIMPLDFILEIFGDMPRIKIIIDLPHLLPQNSMTELHLTHDITQSINQISKSISQNKTIENKDNLVNISRRRQDTSCYTSHDHIILHCSQLLSVIKHEYSIWRSYLGIVPRVMKTYLSSVQPLSLKPIQQRDCAVEPHSPVAMVCSLAL